MNSIHCLFCGWSRIKDDSKGAPEWDILAAVEELCQHLDAVHFAAWHQFLGYWQAYAQRTPVDVERSLDVRT